MINTPKVLFIDWNKTLSHSLFWAQLSDIDHPYNRYHQIITEWLFKKNANLIEPWMRGELTAEQICQFIASENNLDQNTIWQTLKESCENMDLCSPQIIDLINDIRKRGIKVVVATDNMDTFFRFTVPGMRLNEIFDDFLVSYDLGVLKYDIKEGIIPFFDQYIKDNNLNYGEVILLDDSEEKSGIYQKLGFRINLVKDTSDLIKYLKEFAN